MGLIIPIWIGDMGILHNIFVFSAALTLLGCDKPAPPAAQTSEPALVNSAVVDLSGPAWQTSRNLFDLSTAHLWDISIKAEKDDYTKQFIANKDEPVRFTWVRGTYKFFPIGTATLRAEFQASQELRYIGESGIDLGPIELLFDVEQNFSFKWEQKAGSLYLVLQDGTVTVGDDFRMRAKSSTYPLATALKNIGIPDPEAGATRIRDHIKTTGSKMEAPTGTTFEFTMEPKSENEIKLTWQNDENVVSGMILTR